MHTTKFDINAIIRKKMFHHVFQPIYDIQTNRLIGYESLIRSEKVGNPERLFQMANEAGVVEDLDLASISNAIEQFVSHIDKLVTKDLFLNLNIFPSTLTAPFFAGTLCQMIESCSISPDRIVLEINEAVEPEQIEKAKKAASILREAGVKIALDDVGKGNANLQAIIELEPEILKLDIYFAKDLSTHQRKQELIRDLVKMFKQHEIVLEGIETHEDLKIAKRLGVKLGQGYLLGKPNTLEMYRQMVRINKGGMVMVGLRQYQNKLVTVNTARESVIGLLKSIDEDLRVIEIELEDGLVILYPLDHVLSIRPKGSE